MNYNVAHYLNSLLSYYVDGEVNYDHVPTVFDNKTIEAEIPNGTKVNLSIWVIEILI